MKTMLFAAAVVLTVLGAAAQSRKEIVGTTVEQVRWFTPPYYKDGRQRAQLFGDSSQGGAWVDRVKIPADTRPRAHASAG